jgi:hypothetical protein
MAPIQEKKIANVIDSPLSSLSRISNSKNAARLERTAPVAKVPPASKGNKNNKRAIVVRGFKHLMCGKTLGSQTLAISATTADQAKKRAPYNVLRKPAPLRGPPRKLPVPPRPAGQRKPPLKVSCCVTPDQPSKQEVFFSSFPHSSSNSCRETVI